jgi:hypothetical protein
MGQMFDKTHNQMNNWRWDNPHSFRDQVDRSYLQTSTYSNVKPTGERFSWHGSDDLRAKCEAPISRQFNRGDFLAVGPLNLDEIIDQGDDDENWADSGEPSGGSSHPSDGNGYDDSECEKLTQGGDK